MRADSHQRLLARVEGGDQAALGELYDRFAGRVYWVAERLTGSAPAAGEITTAVFLELWRAPGGSFDQGDRLPEYLAQRAHRHSAIWRQRREPRGQEAPPRSV